MKQVSLKNCYLLVHLKKKLERWQKIAASAAEQSGRGRIPEVIVLPDYTSALNRAAMADVAIVFYENERANTLHNTLSSSPYTSVSLLSGPEGGFEEKEITQAMEAVVTKENQNLAIPGVKVAVKTGTAQIGENNSSIDGWVIGFAPADNPKIAVAVVVHNVDLYGSFAAGPIMKAMIEEALKEQ